MSDYASIDPEIQLWAKRHSLSLSTSWAGSEARFAYVSSVAGECFQIWVDPPREGKVALHAACIEGRNDLEPPHSWLAGIAELDATLEDVFQTVLKWMAPSERHFAKVDL